MDHKRGKSSPLLLAGLAVAVAVSIAYLIHPSFIDSTNNRTTDVVLGLAKARPASGAVVIVDIDEKSLARYGRWPWPRDRIAHLLRATEGAGATGVGLDLILAEPERTTVRSAPKGARGALDPSVLKDHDQKLADVLSRGPFVLGYQFLFGGEVRPQAQCDLHPPGIVWVDRSDSSPDRPRFFNANGAVCNRPLFSASVARSGFLNATADADGVLRRVPLLIGYADKLYPSLALALLMQQGRSDQIEALQRNSGRLDLVVGQRSVPVDVQGNLVLQFSRSDQPAARISAEDVLAGRLGPHGLAGKLVLVGSSAAGLDVAYHTAAGSLLDHADVHARVLDNLLTGRQVIRPPDALLWEVLVGLVVAAGAGLAVARTGILTSAGLSLALPAGCWAGMVLIFQTRGLLLSPLLPTVQALLAWVILTILKTWKSQVAARRVADSTLILLKSSEKDLNSIINAVPDIIFRLDAAGRLTFLSPAITKYTSAPDALLGRPILDLVAPEDLPKADHRLNEKRTGARATHGLELRLVLPHRPGEGRELAGPFSISAEGIYRDDVARPDHFLGTQGIIRDIAEQKRLEEKLVQAQKMEAIGRLAAGVAHDLNNILVGLVAYPDLLLLELPQDSPLRDKLSLIQRSGQKAAAIVQDLLTLGRRGMPSQEVVNLNGIISDYLVSLEFQAVRKEHPALVLECDLAPDLFNVKGTRVHLAKALMNMLTNAAEAMPAGGTVRVSSRNCYLDQQLDGYEVIPSGEYVQVTVSDEGVGVAEEDLHRVFEPFFSRKTLRRSGSGLGMTVIWATVKDHGGFINLQSRQGEGTRIELYLPITRESELEVNQGIALENYQGTEQVLVVDDAPEQLQIAASMLGKLGYRVTSVPSGEAAVNHLQRASADLVVLDMIMPGGMDGLETYTRIVELRPGQKAIITSGYSESHRVKKLQELGGGAYVAKPYTLQQIGVAVRGELDR